MLMFPDHVANGILLALGFAEMSKLAGFSRQHALSWQNDGTFNKLGHPTQEKREQARRARNAAASRTPPSGLRLLRCHQSVISIRAEAGIHDCFDAVASTRQHIGEPEPRGVAAKRIGVLDSI